MITRCHLLSLVATCHNSLSLVAPLPITSCLPFVVLINDPRKDNLLVVLKVNALTKLKMFKENL